MNSTNLPGIAYFRIYCGCVLLPVLFILLFAGEDPTARFSDQTKTTQTIIVPGIGADLPDGAMRAKAFFDEQASLAPAETKYIIIYGSEKDYPRDKYPFVPKDHIIYYDPGNTLDRIKGGLNNEMHYPSEDETRKWEKFKKELSKTLKARNSTVFIEMNLSISAFRPYRIWDVQTDWAAKTIIEIASDHSKRFPGTTTKTISHSAGTEPAWKAQEMQRKLIADNIIGEEILDNKSSVAYSARDPKRFDLSTLLVFSKGDFNISPGGKVERGTFRAFAYKDAMHLKEAGYTVLLQEPKPNYLISKDVCSVTEKRWNYLQAHITHQADDPNQTLTVFIPGHDQPVPLPWGATVAQVMKLHAAPQKSGNETIPRNRKEILINYINRVNPSDNLGGISLNAVAALPVNAAQVSYADYDYATNALFLVMKNGNVIRFPYMDGETVRLSYESAYKKDKPELSIGSSPVSEGNTVFTRFGRAGMSPVFYLGNTENTYLGLAMYLADKTWNTLAFGSSAETNAVFRAVPGFHTLPELFPVKYTDNPAQQYYLGSQRVMLNSSSVELSLSADEQQLQFGNVGFEVKLPGGGPAENYYAAFFNSHLNEILSTEVGRPLKRLIPYAKAAAIFRWLKLNNIKFRQEKLLEVPITKVYTPLYTESMKTPELKDIAPAYPTIDFGVHGPLTIFYSANSKTVITYSKGHVVSVVCANGKALDVYRDDIGLPVAYYTNNDNGAFYVHQYSGMVLYKNVMLQNEPANLKIRLTNQSVVYPENQAEQAIQGIIADFIYQNKPR